MSTTEIQEYLNKPTAAVHIRNSFTATERKLVNICLHEGLKDNFAQEEYAVDIRKTLELLGCGKSKNSLWLKDKLFEALRAKPIKWNVLKKDSKLQEWTCSFLSGFVYEPEYGKLAFQFNPIAKKQFQQRRLYSKLLLQIQAPIKSGHALTLYEYLNDELQRHRGKIEKMPLALADLRSLLDIDEDQYPAFKYFNQRAIKPAFKEINEHTDIEAACEFIRENRNVVALHITAKRQHNFKLSHSPEYENVPDNELESSENTGLKLLMAYGITKNKAAELTTVFSAEQLAAGINYTIDRHNENKVKNIASYLIKAIDKGYGIETSKSEQIKRLERSWAIYRNNQASKLFEALTFEDKKVLQDRYVKTIESSKSGSFALNKFRYDGGWNSNFIQNDFRNKFVLTLLKDPIDTDFEVFKEWWPQQKLKNLLEEVEKRS